LPCIGCAHKSECYDSGELALRRIVPVSFYPFYLMICEPADLNAADFLALLSGASPGDLETRLETRGEHGRTQLLKSLTGNRSSWGGLLFTDDPRRFPEVLYLKCSLLAQLAETVFSGQTEFLEPDLALTPERLWVCLHHRTSLLPMFWNASLHLIEMDELSKAASRLPFVPPSYAMYALGCLWFQVLAGNERLSEPDITRTIVDRINAATASEGDTTTHDTFPAVPEIFSPENLFWEPGEVALPPEWTALWNEALGLGWALVEQGIGPDPSFSSDAFQERIHALRSRIRNSLFAAPQVPAEGAGSSDHALRGIVDDIITSWSALGEEPSLGGGTDKPSFEPEVPGRQEPVPDQEDEQETVILSSHDLAGGEPGRPEEPVTSAPDQHEDETLKGVTLGAEPSGLPRGDREPSEAAPQDDLSETVILERPVTEKIPAGEKGLEQREEDGSETAIVELDDSAVTTETGPGSFREENDVSKTAIVGRDDSVVPTETGPASLGEEADGLDTVIVGREDSAVPLEEKPLPVRQEDDVPETMILDAHQEQTTSEEARPRKETPKPEDSQGDDFLEETVIVEPKKKP
ncbi:MAG: hypothetical protein RRA35_03795, partial [Desulfomonilia bacterium]|nr:hypothetical protein [Desulfomonilia bacterium]